MPPALKRRMSALMAETTVEMLGDSGITWVGIVSYVVALYALSVYVAFLVNPPAGTMTILGVSFHSFFPFGIDLPNAEPILCPYGHHISYGCNWWRGLVNLILFLQLVCIHALLHISSVQKDYLPLGNLQRSAYCLVGGVQLIAFCAMWQSDVTGIMLWEGVEWLNWPYYVCVAIFVSATFVDDHFALFGIKQSTGLDVYEKLGVPSNTGLGARWHRRFVRHPMITCLVLMHMLTPSMSFEHLMLIFCVAGYGYFYVHQILEREILQEGTAKSAAYAEYIAEVGTFAPVQLYTLMGFTPVAPPITMATSPSKQATSEPTMPETPTTPFTMV